MINTYKARLQEKIQLTYNVYLFKFKLIEPAEIHFISGQYLTLMIPQNDHAIIRRLYSITSPDFQKDSFELIIKIIPNGIAGQYFTKLNIGDFVTFNGPAGRFILKNSPKNKIFLATGIGIAPIISILKSALSSTVIPSEAEGSLPAGRHGLHSGRDDKASYKLLWGVPNFKDVFLFEEFKKMSEDYPNFTFKICLSREENLNSVLENDRKYFNLGRINAKSEMLNANFYLCGSREIVESLKSNLHDLKVEDQNVFFEKF